MITRLEQLTVAQFIDLVSGKLSVLMEGVEKIDDSRLTMSLRNIVFEYRLIADKSGAQSYLSLIDDYIKRRMDVMVFSMCHNLVSFNEPEIAKLVMNTYGINTEGMNNRRVVTEITSRLERARIAIEKLEKDILHDTDEITSLRSSFDEQTASLMAHYKFQIDISTMRATQYAYLVARLNREVKAQIEAMKRK